VGDAFSLTSFSSGEISNGAEHWWQVFFISVDGSEVAFLALRLLAELVAQGFASLVEEWGVHD